MIVEVNIRRETISEIITEYLDVEKYPAKISKVINTQSTKNVKVDHMEVQIKAKLLRPVFLVLFKKKKMKAVRSKIAVNWILPHDNAHLKLHVCRVT